MRNQSVIGMAGQSQRVWAAADHDYLFFNFAEGAGSNISDKSGAIAEYPLIGTAPAWASKQLGIDPAAGSGMLIRSGADSTATADQIERAARIYAGDANGRLGGIKYVMFRLQIAAAPASDTSNIVYAAGREGTGVELYGQHHIRLRTSRSPELALRRVGQNSLLNYSNANAALVAGGAARSYLLVMSEANDTDLLCEWFIDGGGAPNSSVTLANGLAEFTRRADSAGMGIFGRTSSTQAWGAASTIATGSVAPVVHWLGCGHMAATPANRTALLAAYQGLHRSGVMPIAFSRITR